MNRRQSGRRAISVLLALAVVVGGLSVVVSPHVTLARPVQVATGSSIAETAVAGFQFSTTEYSQVPTNVTINVTFSDDDSTGNDHSFAIIDRANWQAPAGADLSTVLSTYHTLLWLNASYPQTVQGNFTAPGPGWYEFICTVPGHFQEGMIGFIAFGEAVPSNLSAGPAAMGAGLAVFIIVGTIVTLTVLMLVLGFVVGRRRGSVHEMPPERLGYPEPLVARPSGTQEPPAPPR